MICIANQWTGFYIIGISGMKALNFPTTFKFANIKHLFLWMILETDKIIIDQKIFGQLLPKYLKNSSVDNFQIILMWFSNRLRHSHCLLLIMGTWKEAVDNKKVVGPILTELSKSLDYNLSLSTHRKITCLWTVFSCLKIDTVIPPKPKAGKKVQYVL